MDIDVFISYSHKDLQFALVLYQRLKEAGLFPWMDSKHIPNGAFWRPEIDRNLDIASLVLVIVSPDSMKSAYVTYEWSYVWFKRQLDILDLYWVYYRECKRKIGMFGRLTDDSQFPVEKCLQGNPTDDDLDDILTEISSRLKKLNILKEARNILRNSDGNEQEQIEAAKILGKATHYKFRACEYLIEGLQNHLNPASANGNVQSAIARALSNVGDLRAIPYLEMLAKFTTDQNPIQQALSTMQKIASKAIT